MYRFGVMGFLVGNVVSFKPSAILYPLYRYRNNLNCRIIITVCIWAFIATKIGSL